MNDSKGESKMDCSLGNNQEMLQGLCVTRSVEQFH